MFTTTKNRRHHQMNLIESIDKSLMVCHHAHSHPSKTFEILISVHVPSTNVTTGRNFVLFGLTCIHYTTQINNYFETYSYCAKSSATKMIYIYLLWLFSFYVVHSGSGFIISDVTTIRTTHVTTSKPQHPTKLYYSNSNDLISYQQQQQQQARLQLPSVNDTVLSKAFIGTAVTSRVATTAATTTTTITTLDDFYKVIQECQQQNSLLIVHWSAPWCRSCQRIAPLLQRMIQQVAVLANKLSSSSTTSPGIHRPNIRYVNIPLLYSLSTLNQDNSSIDYHHHQQQHPNQNHRTNLHAMFDIRTVPYCHIYHPTDGFIQEFTITTNSKTKKVPTKKSQPTKTILEVQQILESYITSGTNNTN